MNESGFFQVTLGGLIGSSIATAILGALFLRRNKNVEAEIKAYFDQKFSVFQSTRAWKETALSELFGPLMLQFERTKSAFYRWRAKNTFLEAQIVRQGNQTIRDLLLAKAHLMPPALHPHATDLVIHYDVWMEVYDRVRGAKTDDATEFVFAGPEGYPFPCKAEDAFRSQFEVLQKELYGISAG